MREELVMLYRKFSDLVTTHEEVLASPDSEQLLGHMMEADTLWQRVKKPEEMVRDARLVLDLARLARRQAEAGQVNLLQFGQEEFSRRLVETVTGRGGEDVTMSRHHWVKFGVSIKSAFRRSPALTYLYGALDSTAPGVVEGKVRKERQGRRVEELVATQEEVLASTQSSGDQTEERVKQLFTSLVSCWKNKGKTPIDYFAFTMDPNSFGITVENMFHTSFLVKEGRARVQMDQLSGLPTICPVSSKEVGRSQVGTNQAVIMNFTYSDWEKVVAGLGLTSSCLGTRQEK